MNDDALDSKMQDESELLRLPANMLQKRISDRPDYLFFFGAGASFGSDSNHLVKLGRIPPLGRDLFQSLHDDSNLKYWHKLPLEITTLFRSNSFEVAMDLLEDNEEWAKESFKRDLDLSRFFSTFRPLESNLYWKLARAISRILKGHKWTGAAITLNYERLLEESLMRNNIFTVVNGVTYYDDELPLLTDDQLFEICYPHGACQFFLGQNWFKLEGDGNIVFGKTAEALQKAGVNHILKSENIPRACDMNQIPMICRYQPSKRPTIKNYFIDTQQDRCSELIVSSKHITIIGVFCSHATDMHLWEPLGRTKAFITYVNPNKDSQDQFKEWAIRNGKTENSHYRIIPKTFKDAFEEILKVNSSI